MKASHILIFLAKNTHFPSGYMEYVEQIETLFVTEGASLKQSGNGSYFTSGSIYIIEVPSSTTDENNKFDENIKANKLDIVSDNGFDKVKTNYSISQ